MRATRSRRSPASSACRKAATCRSPSCSRRNTRCRPATSSGSAGTSRPMRRPITAYAPPDHATGQTPNATPFWMVGAAGAEVEVDTETGHVRVTRLVNVADVGRAVNPRIVDTQLSGAAIMQLGFTMQEKIELDGGQIVNASLADYKIPSILDIPPDIHSEVVEAEQHSGPFGAKGAGESGTFGVSPAIANAIDDAVGVRLTSLPLTAETLYRALRAAQNDPLEE